MKKIALTLITGLTFLALFQLNAQKDPIRDEFFDGEFFLAEEEYSEAIQAYLKVFNAGNQDNANINYRIGMCYINIPGEKNKAIPYLEKAVTNVSPNYREGVYKDPKAPVDSWLFLGNAYRIDYQLDKAINAYNKFLELSPKGKPADISFTNQQIQACERAKKLINNPAEIKKENLGRKYNTNQNNFQAVFSADGSAMAYMSSQRFYDAVYVVRKINNTWTNPVNVTSQIESDGDQYINSLSLDGSKMFLTRISAFNADIMESEFLSGMWTKSVPLNKNINSKYFESHASLSPDGNSLYITSNRNESLGGMDIFISKKDAAGNWGAPVNPGKTINTEFNEETPFICEDGKTLFFSSQGHNSIGGYDIFYTVIRDDGSWSEPVPLPYPINTTDDDLFFFPVDNGKAGYMTCYMEEGFGSGDIYFISISTAVELSALGEEEKVAPEEVIAEEITTEEPAVVQVEPSEQVTEKIKTPEAVEPTVKYLIKPVYFNFDSYALTEESLEKVDVITSVLKQYKGMVLEIRGHTDAIGTNDYNQLLSERRAKAVMNYLISKGIESGRLKYKGLSMSEPVAANKNPDGTDNREGRRFNRRVEFRVLVNPADEVIIQPAEVPDALKIRK